jgi:hypothetical protein
MVRRGGVSIALAALWQPRLGQTCVAAKLQKNFFFAILRHKIAFERQWFFAVRLEILFLLAVFWEVLRHAIGFPK